MSRFSLLRRFVRAFSAFPQRLLARFSQRFGRRALWFAWFSYRFGRGRDGCSVILFLLVCRSGLIVGRCLGRLCRGSLFSTGSAGSDSSFPGGFTVP